MELLATVKDILRDVRGVARTREAAREWLLTFDSISDAIFLLDDRGVVVRSNRAGAALVQRHPREIVGEPLRALIAATLDVAAADAIDGAVRRCPVRGEEIALGDRWFLATIDEAVLPAQRRRVTVALTDIQARKAAELARERLLCEAEDARYAAERANRAKTTFLSVISHEVRTPLNAIVGYTELLADGLRGPITAEQEGDLERVQRAAAYVTRIVNDLLDLVRLESAEADVTRERVDLTECIATAAALVTPTALEKTIVLSIGDMPSAFACLGDRDRIVQVLVNLLSNAIKFTPEGGAVDVSGRHADGRVAVAVRDTGRGIAPNQMEAIFAPFVQVGNRLGGSERGLGLGLAISRALARRMGGALTVESALGAGSTFTLTLPPA